MENELVTKYMHVEAHFHNSIYTVWGTVETAFQNDDLIFVLSLWSLFWVYVEYDGDDETNL